MRYRGVTLYENSGCMSFILLLTTVLFVAVSYSLWSLDLDRQLKIFIGLCIALFTSTSVLLTLCASDWYMNIEKVKDDVRKRS